MGDNKTLACVMLVVAGGFALGQATVNPWLNIALTLPLVALVLIGDAIVSAVNQLHDAVHPPETERE